MSETHSPKDYSYLIDLYKKVNTYLDNGQTDENFPDVIVSFCTVVEKFFKIKLHAKNPLLVFDHAKFQDKDAFFAIALEEEENIRCIKFEEVITRFNRIFPDTFTEEELEMILSVYTVRNAFNHSYKPDSKLNFESEDILKKMGSVWTKVSKEATDLFGNSIIKSRPPKKKYSEEQLSEIFKEEVRKKIESYQKIPSFSLNTYHTNIDPVISGGTLSSGAHTHTIAGIDPHYLYGTEGTTAISGGGGGSHLHPLTSISNGGYLVRPGKKISQGLIRGFPEAIVDCPRCGQLTLELFSDLYECYICNLELTAKELEVAKKIKEEGKDKTS